jgi:hypothetical protein
MTIKFELIRPDDLLNLRFEGENLRLDASKPKAPVLVVEDPSRPAFLVVIFPPQTIAETAFFESSDVPQDVSDPGPPQVPKSDPDAHLEDEKLPSPGQVKARMGHPSQLVFKVPAKVRIPFTIEGVLDWSKLDLNVNPIAAIPPDPTPAQIAAAPAIAAPKPTETFIELPYRLTISPNGEVAWAHRPEPFTSRGRTELWHTRLQLKTQNGTAELTRANPAPLRAIWSGDYNPIDPPKPDEQDPILGRTAMAPNDRHQIVILTSAFHGYEVDKTFSLTVSSALAGDFAQVRSARARIPLPVKFTVPYVPEPFFADQLMLSPLGGWLRSRGNWDPPRRAQPKPPIVIPKFDDVLKNLVVSPLRPPRTRTRREVPAAAPVQPLAQLTTSAAQIFDPGLFSLLVPTPAMEELDLSEWVHVATQGRDHYVRIVYEGELWPFRHRAALIKVTERKFKDVNNRVVAYLFQRMFIVVREPEKRFADSDRGNPFKRVQLTTLVTPDIALPSTIPGTLRSFWVEVMTSATSRARFDFHAVGTDVAGNRVDFTIPLLFVSKSEQTTQRKTAAQEYNRSGSQALRDKRSAQVPGQKLVFAERNAAAPSDNTELVTRALNFVMDTAGSAASMLLADVNIPQVADLLGTDAPTTIRFYENYVKSGLDAATGVFAEIVKIEDAQFLPDNPFAGLVANTLGVNFSSDQAGGFATPNLGVSTLSRELGPLAGKVQDAVADQFDPASFFQKGMAQLFGSFDLVDLLPSGTLAKNAPQLKTNSQDIPGGKLLIATLDWQPEVKNLDLGIAAFEKDYKGNVSKLVIHGRIEKPVTVDSLGAPVTAGVKYDFKGTLNDFRVSVLKAVYINFAQFGFHNQTNAKTDVTVKLDPATPVEFAGDLKFVEELRKAIPPDLFGDGPSLDIAPTGIRAGFAFALPPLAVGVFALKDVSLGAALTLPFLDGKPTFDFNVSERAHPFLLAVGIFGGGGFFRLQLDTAGLKMVEAAFEFGAVASIDLGLASGGVHIMAGIYFKLERKEPSNDLAPTLSGYLRMGGYLSVLGLIKVSLEFNLSFTYDGAKDKAYGRATLTVKVEIVFFSVSVELTVEKSFGGHGGDPKFIELFTTPEVWNEYASAFA